VTSAEAAARVQRAAASLLDLARDGQRVLHLSPSLAMARFALEDVAKLAPATEGRVYRTNGRYGYENLIDGEIRFISARGDLHTFATAFRWDVVVVAPDVELDREALGYLAMMRHYGARVRTAGGQ
jgi:hypothetical protein